METTQEERERQETESFGAPIEKCLTMMAQACAMDPRNKAMIVAAALKIRHLDDRLAAIESQVLWRTEGMPEDAVGWFRGRANSPHWVIRFDTGYTDGVQVNGPVAPEFRPDELGPMFLPILDTPEGR